MMPEQPAKQRTLKKKPKPKHITPKPVTDENVTNNKCSSEQKSQPHQLKLASDSQNAVTPIVTVNDKPKTVENIPAAPLPRIVIKIHQGRIVSPPAIASSVSTKKHTSEHSTVDSQESKSSDAGTQRTEKSDRIKAQPLSKPAKETAGNKSQPKIASQSKPSKVLADRNSNMTYFDSSHLQNSGSFDKLSMDCYMKLYSQIRDQQKASQPSQSLSESSKSSKLSSGLKSRHKSSSDRAVRVSETKKCSLDQSKQTSSGFESLPKMQALSSGKLSASDCTVQLDRLKSVGEVRSSVHKLPADDSCQIVRKSCSSRERQTSSKMYDFAAGGDDDMADKSCSVTLTPRSHTTRSDVPVQRSDVPTATETVPGSSIPLSKPQRSFSTRSHALTDSYNSASVSPKKSCIAEIASYSNSSAKKSQTDILSSLLGHSVDDSCTSKGLKNCDKVLSGINLTNSQLSACDVTDCDELSRGSEVPSAAVDSEKVKNSNIRHVTKAALESTNSSLSDTEHSRSSVALAGQKHCRSIDDLGSSNVISKPGSVKKARMSHLLGELSNQLTREPLVSASVEDMASAASICCSPSQTTASNANTAVSQNTAVPEFSSASEPSASDERWTSPTCSPDTNQTVESSTLPLRLKIRRLPEVSPDTEIYNVIGRDAETDSTFSASCGTLFIIFNMQ